MSFGIPTAAIDSVHAGAIETHMPNKGYYATALLEGSRGGAFQWPSHSPLDPWVSSPSVGGALFFVLVLAAFCVAKEGLRAPISAPEGASVLFIAATVVIYGPWWLALPCFCFGLWAINRLLQLPRTALLAPRLGPSLPVGGSKPASLFCPHLIFKNFVWPVSETQVTYLGLWLMDKPSKDVKGCPFFFPGWELPTRVNGWHIRLLRLLCPHLLFKKLTPWHTQHLKLPGLLCLHNSLFKRFVWSVGEDKVTYLGLWTMKKPAKTSQGCPFFPQWLFFGSQKAPRPHVRMMGFFCPHTTLFKGLVRPAGRDKVSYMKFWIMDKPAKGGKGCPFAFRLTFPKLLKPFQHAGAAAAGFGRHLVWGAHHRLASLPLLPYVCKALGWMDGLAEKDEGLGGAPGLRQLTNMASDLEAFLKGRSAAFTASFLMLSFSARVLVVVLLLCLL